MNAHVALADDIPIPFDWNEHDERPDCWCGPDVETYVVGSPAVYVHRRPVEYDMVTGVGRVVSRWE